MSQDQKRDDFAQLSRMRLASALEGSTLISLLVIAVPLKHLLGVPLGVRLLGPVHGLAFVFYFFTLVQTLTSMPFSKSDSSRMIVAAFIPLGAFFNKRLLMRSLP